MNYQKALEYQTNLFQSIVDVKAQNRSLPENEHRITNNYLLFCEHPHVFTLGKSGDEKHLLVKKDDLHAIDATYYHINRGGDITYHGPGQIVVYPIIDLENFFTDIHQYMRLLEESVIQTLAEFNIKSGRIKGLTGVWLDYENEKTTRKICALGVKSSRLLQQRAGTWPSGEVWQLAAIREDTDSRATTAIAGAAISARRP